MVERDEVLQHEETTRGRRKKEMKKTMAVLAVLAVAAAAQAEMLATWSSSGVDNKNELATFGALEAVNGAGTTSGGIFAVNKMEAGGGVGFSYTINSDYQVDNTKISGSYGGATSGPKQLDWYLGVDATAAATDTKITSATPIIRTGSTTGTFTDTDLGTLKGSGYVKLLANTAEGNYNGGTLASNGTFNFRTATGFNPEALKLSGDVNPASAVPEPATMSLLGLGALAMVLRRKLRK
jgi:hypothetical protein